MIDPTTKIYNLESRSLKFAQDCRILVSYLPKSLANTEDSRQLIRSSGSIGANYIEANEKLSKKDLILRLKIAKKEAKESRYWLTLLAFPNTSNAEQLRLIQESTELMNILGAIIIKCT
jgi:four helix bundle protein